MTKQPTTKHLIGRPTKYCAEVVQKTQEYVAELEQNKEIVPTIEKLTLRLGVEESTLYAWAKRNKAFSKLTKKIKTMQRDFLIERAMGRFNPAGAIFILKALHGWVDTTRVEQAGNVTIQILPGYAKKEINSSLKEIKNPENASPIGNELGTGEVKRAKENLI